MRRNSSLYRILHSLSFLLPSRVIKEEHLVRRDILAIKRNLCGRLSAVGLFLSAFLSIANVLLFTMHIATSGGHNVEVYGLWSFVGQLVGFFGSSIVFTLHLISLLRADAKWSTLLARISIDLFYFIVLTQLIVSLYTDATMGYATGSEVISPAVLFVSVLLLSQSPYWIDDIILNANAALTIAFVALACHNRYGLGGVSYYIIVCISLPIFASLIDCLLFFAECKNYCQVMANERIYNDSLYDELTHCKNRTALKHFASDLSSRQAGFDVELLFIMFDIDEFKLFNDQFSHIGGDNCLRLVAESIRKAFPLPSLDFFRYGGEEFLLILEVTGIEGAKVAMEKARTCVYDTHIASPEGAPKPYVSISLGGALLRQGDFSDVLAKADRYLYQAKGHGKDVSCFEGQFLDH